MVLLLSVALCLTAIHAAAQPGALMLKNAGARTLMQSAVVALNKGDLEQAEKVFLQMDSLIRKEGTTREKAYAGLTLAKFYCQLNRPKESEEYLARIRPLLLSPSSYEDSLNLANYYIVRSTNKTGLSNLNEAIRNLDSGVSIAVKLKNNLLKYEVHIKLAALYSHTGSARKAVMEAGEAEKWVEKTDTGSRAYINYITAEAFAYLHVYDSSVIYNKTALRLYRALGSKQDEYMIVERLAEDYLDIYRTSRDPKYIGYIDELDMAAAVDFLRPENGNMLDLYCQLCNAYGGYMLVKNKYGEAEKYGKIAYAIADSLNIIPDKIVACRLLLRTTLQQHGANTDYLDKYFDAVTAKYSHDNAQEISELEERYQVKEKEEALLAARNAALVSGFKAERNRKYLSYAILMAALAVGGILLYNRRKRYLQKREISELKKKALDLQMNPHFIFNCMTAIQHFILQKDVRQSNKYLSDLAVLMRKTLDMSLTDRISLEDEVDYLTCYLALQQLRFENRFDYRVVVEQGIAPAGIDIYPMMVQPFIENAVEHAFPADYAGQGNITVTFAKEDGKLVCRVEDNGMGREASAKRKDAESRHISHGMSLIRKRLALTGGTAANPVIITDKKDGNGLSLGTVVTIKFGLAI